VLAAPTDSDDRAVQKTILRLLRARMSLEFSSPVTVEGERLLASTHRATHDEALLLLLAYELAETHGLTGELAKAREYARATIMASRALGLPVVEVAARAELASQTLGLGEIRQSREEAARAWDILRSTGRSMPYLRARIALVDALAATSGAQELPTDWRPPGPLDFHPGDVSSIFWDRILRSRLAVMEGSLTRAAQELLGPHPGPLPRRLQIVLLVERALLAGLGGDGETLDRVTASLDDLGARAEAALARALRADRAGDLRRACMELERATGADATLHPPVASLARVLRSQLLDRLGETERARDELATAVVATEASASVMPFLDWSWHGTRVHRLLERHSRTARGGWTDELLHFLRAGEATSGLVARLGPGRATDVSRSPGAPPVPSLSTRELDVLYELARGATYADIAGTLFVSQNTVKSHVSSLYAKLSVTRRSEALTAARALGLI